MRLTRYQLRLILLIVDWFLRAICIHKYKFYLCIYLNSIDLWEMLRNVTYDGRNNKKEGTLLIARIINAVDIGSSKTKNMFHA